MRAVYILSEHEVEAAVRLYLKRVHGLAATDVTFSFDRPANPVPGDYGAGVTATATIKRQAGRGRAL